MKNTLASHQCPTVEEITNVVNNSIKQESRTIINAIDSLKRHITRSFETHNPTNPSTLPIDSITLTTAFAPVMSQFQNIDRGVSNMLMNLCEGVPACLSCDSVIHRTKPASFILPHPVPHLLLQRNQKLSNGSPCNLRPKTNNNTVPTFSLMPPSSPYPF